MSPGASDVTRLLQDLSAAEGSTQERSEATERLLALVYDELRRIASRMMSAERSSHTLQPTALVHEAYIKLIGQESLAWNDRAHFMSISARAMRQILIDHARRRRADKRGGGLQQVTLEDALARPVSTRTSRSSSCTRRSTGSARKTRGLHRWPKCVCSVA